MSWNERTNDGNDDTTDNVEDTQRKSKHNCMIKPSECARRQIAEAARKSDDETCAKRKL